MRSTGAEDNTQVSLNTHAMFSRTRYVHRKWKGPAIYCSRRRRRRAYFSGRHQCGNEPGKQTPPLLRGVYKVWLANDGLRGHFYLAKLSRPRLIEWNIVGVPFVSGCSGRCRDSLVQAAGVGGHETVITKLWWMLFVTFSGVDVGSSRPPW